MIFLTAEKATMLLMLSEQDLQKLRAGSSLFVDDRATKGHLFNRVIIGWGKTDAESIKMVESAGHKLDHSTGLVSHEAKPGEAICAGCQGIMEPCLLLDGKCIVCWAGQAKKLMTARN